MTVRKSCHGGVRVIQLCNGERPTDSGFSTGGRNRIETDSLALSMARMRRTSTTGMKALKSRKVKRQTICLYPDMRGYYSVTLRPRKRSLNIWHFDGFSFSPAAANLVRTSRILARWLSRSRLNMMTSSRYAKHTW